MLFLTGFYNLVTVCPNNEHCHDFFSALQCMEKVA